MLPISSRWYGKSIRRWSSASTPGGPRSAARSSAAGADLLNDAWGGHRPALAEVAAAAGVGLVCSHAGGLPPRTDPHRVSYDDVVRDVIDTVVGLAERAVAVGVRPDGILIDPAHDFGKNTRHSLEVSRRLDELVATGWPVLVALSNKKFIGETLDLPAGRTARRERSPRLRSRPGKVRASFGPTRFARPGRHSTWWRRCAGTGRPRPRDAPSPDLVGVPMQPQGCN